MLSSPSTTVVVVCVILLVFASIFVGLRFKVRKNTKAGLAADDFIILGALLLQYAAAAMTIFGAVSGAESDWEHNLFTNSSKAVPYRKILFAGPLIFATSIALIKISTLILYTRIFVTKGFRLACYMVMTLTTGWFLASIFPQIFQSKPVSNTWNSPGRPRVINFPAYLLSLAAINTVLDLIVVCMPLFVIRTLHMSSRRKFLVSGIFLLGLFCIIASAVRLYYFVELTKTPTRPGSSYTNVVANNRIWSFIEPEMSIAAACLPTLAPLLRGARDPASIIRSAQSILSLGSISSKISGKGSKASNASSEREDKEARHAWLQLSSNRGFSNNITSERDVELDRIQNAQQASNGITVQKSLKSEIEPV